ncbi:MAG: helix-turn-helix transcriptional regulator [Bacteroidales bacterium]|nr:helix-turn-helix transcriptional regulator [Bacteroidales bacterium]
MKNMICRCCVSYLSDKLLAAGVKIIEISLGQLSVEVKNQKMLKITEEIISELGFEIIQNRDLVLVEQIKMAIIDLIHHLNNANSVIRKSDYLVEKLGMSYPHLSKTFSMHEPITLEKYIILQKVEKIKELIDSDEYSMSEISYLMDYSSIQHLSAQFKQITGLTPSDYKKSDRSMRKSIDELY